MKRDVVIAFTINNEILNKELLLSYYSNSLMHGLEVHSRGEEGEWPELLKVCKELKDEGE